jgi:hypothetical protein
MTKEGEGVLKKAGGNVFMLLVHRYFSSRNSFLGVVFRLSRCELKKEKE